ncbi:MAG: hypothetical protein KAS58_00965, partial [Calditrichia bacterium]|nr:hypothetical protein [Calditrichia bacterium]
RRMLDLMLDTGYWILGAGCSILDITCHPVGIYALVGTAEASTCKNPYPNEIPFRDRMTGKIR